MDMSLKESQPRQASRLAGGAGTTIRSPRTVHPIKPPKDLGWCKNLSGSIPTRGVDQACREYRQVLAVTCVPVKIREPQGFPMPRSQGVPTHQAGSSPTSTLTGTKRGRSLIPTTSQVAMMSSESAPSTAR